MTINTNTGAIAWTPTEAQGPCVTSVTVRVYDDGTPIKAATNSFTVWVNEVNVAPMLQTVTNRTLRELTLLTVTNTATDADLPANALSYTLVGVPDGMAISTAGVITWTPAENQGPSTNLITTVATDNGVPPLAATNSFTVWVSEVNSAPVLTVPTNRTISELTLLSVTNTATDADVPANRLRFELLAWPSGMSIDTNTGAIAWTPAEAQGPSTNTVTVRVYDDGTPSLAATNSFTVWVSEVNTSPVLPTQADREINTEALLLVTNTATDADLPANTLTYSLMDAPEGAAISGAGVISWIPTRLQGGSTNTFTTKVTDNGSPALSATNSFKVTVRIVNHRPVLAAIPDFTLVAGETLDYRILAIDSDWPSNTLTYTLNTYSMFDPPANEATLDSHTGQFTWSAADADEGNVLWFAVTVTDNGVPPLASSRIFQVEVSGYPPVLDLAVVNSMPHLMWNTVSARRYQIQYKARLTDSQWTDLGGVRTATGAAESLDDDAVQSHTNRFYRAVLLPAR